MPKTISAWYDGIPLANGYALRGVQSIDGGFRNETLLSRPVKSPLAEPPRYKDPLRKWICPGGE
jgi:hypothetical protein